MADYEKIGKEVRALFTAYPVEPETEEGRMVADLRYPGWREKGVPPAVPTPEAVERWGRSWWLWEPGYSEPQIVYIGGHSEYPLHILPVGSDAEDEIDGAGEWLGPVLERPVRREG